MTTLLKLACCALLGAAASAAAHGPEVLPAYQPAATVSGVIRVWTNPEMQETVRRWSAGFRHYHPGAQVAADYRGSDVAVAGLYTRAADLALLGREATPSEIQAFEWIYRFRPTRVEVLTGSLDQPGHSPALAVFVHKDNPLASLSLAQLDALFDHEARRGAHPIATWGQLGLGGEWKDRPIRLYTYDAWSGSGRYFRHAALEDSRNLNWDRLREVADSGAGRNDAGRRILAALAADRYGIAVASLSPDSPGARPLALAGSAGEAPLMPSRDALVARRYPLYRSVVALVNRAPGQPIDPKVAEFLRYVLSREGQAAAEGGGYLPLAAPDAARQLERLP